MADVGLFHRLVIDPHIKEYLMDGETFDIDWCRAAVAQSEQLFCDHGVGLWLVYQQRHADPIGFCGFFVFEELGPNPQLLYALQKDTTGRGYATEIATTLVAYAHSHAGMNEIIAGVDEPNRASLRVLQKVGFTHLGTLPGPFGQTLMLRWRPQSDNRTKQ